MKYPSILLKSMATAAVLFALSACLYPVGVDPDFKLIMDMNAKAGGELLTNTINSAEVQIQNHTSSVNITLVNIQQTAWSTQDVNGQKTAVQTTSVAARITGGPHIESREQVLLRPISYNSLSAQNDAYVLTFEYKRATGDKADKYYNDPAHAGASREGRKTLTIEDLPRGKYLIHVYRNINGEIEIGVDPVDESKKDSADFTNNFSVNNYIDGLNFSGATFNTHPNTKVDFSDEFKAQFKALMSAGTNEIVNAINGFNRFPNGYAPVVVYNHTPYPASLGWTMKNRAANATITERTGSLSPIGAYDQDAVLLRMENYEGTVKWIAASFVANESRKTIPLFGMNQAYVHIYKTKTGDVDFAVTDNANYWTLDTIKTINNIDISYLNPRFDKPTVFVIKNKTADTNLEAYIINNFDGSQETYVENIRKGDTSVSLMVSELAYNFTMIIRNKATMAAVVDQGIVILPGDWPLTRDTNIYKLEKEPVRPPQTIAWKITANGGPQNGIKDSDRAYDTTTLTATFTVPVKNVVFDLVTTDGYNSGAGWAPGNGGSIDTIWKARYNPLYNHGQYENEASVPPGPYKFKIDAATFVEEWRLVTAESEDTRDIIGLNDTQEVTVYSHRKESVAHNYHSEYYYVDSGIKAPEGVPNVLYSSGATQDTAYLQRYTPYRLKWFFTYEERKYDGGAEIDTSDRPRTTIDESTHPSFGTLERYAAILGNPDYCIFDADGSFRIGYGGKGVRSPYLITDKKPNESGYRWSIQSGVTFAGNKVDGKTIKNMPYAKRAIYIWYLQIGTITVYNSKAVNIWVEN